MACVGAIAPVTDDDALAYVVPIARHIARSGTVQMWSDQARSMWPLSHEVLLAAIMKVGGDRLGALSALEWLLAVAAFQVAAAEEDLLVTAATAGAAFCLAGSGTIAEPAIATGWRALRS